MRDRDDAERKELDELTSQTVSSLGQTADTFASRLRRKLREKELAEQQGEKARELRHQSMLQAMTSIRKALQEAAKMDLGRRFVLKLEVSDCEGWPRLELRLVDLLMPQSSPVGLVVLSHDRSDQGIVQFSRRDTDECYGRLNLANSEELKKLPVVLKNSLRRFLDDITPQILNPRPLQELEDDRPLALEEEDPLSARLRGEDLFSEEEEYSPDSNRVASEELVPIFSK